MQVAIYARVSTKEQAENGVSIEMQLDKLRKYAELHDHEIVEEIRDEGCSAKDLNRDGIQRVLELLRTGAIEGVVIYKLDRLTRSVRDLHSLLDEYFREDKYALCSVCDQLDTTTSTGRLILNVMVSVSEWERETIGERTRDGLQHKKKCGEVYCGRLYGFDSVDGKLVPNEDEQYVIASIVECRRNLRWSFSSIADHLNQLPIAPPKGKRWYHATVKQIYERELQKKSE